MKKLCIFDLDGTLASTLESMAVAANRVLREMNLPEQPTESFKYFAGDGAKELCRRCLRAAGDAECSQYEEMYRKYREYFSETCMYKVVPYEGIPELLEKLKAAGIKISVLSNKPHARTVENIEAVFGKGYFDIVAGQKDDVPKKPDPAGVNRILEEFGCKPEECLYFGDTNTDMQTGLNAKAHTVGVTWGFRDRAELEAFHPDFVIDDPKMVTNHILASFS